jgi:hypothetical protein
MKRKLSFISPFIIAMLISVTLLAQNENDALRYSLINYQGTARFSGLSGAYGAVGADFSSLSQNPAGIGLYRKSEFTITPMFSSNNTTSDFMHESNKDSRNTMYLGNAGYVYSMNTNGHAGALVQMQFGFGINMMTAFSNRMVISGFNSDNSLLTTYTNQVNTSGQDLKDWDNYGAGLAYDVDLIFYDSTAQRWAADMEGGGIRQTKSIETYGSTNETVLSAGANISDKLFLGVTFAFPFIRYHEESRLTETDTKNLNTYFDSFDRYEYLETRGAGFNFKAGFIFIPVQFLRIGGSIHTPTNYYNMTDNWHATMYSTFDNGDTYSKTSPDGYFDYKLKTPLRATGSVAFIIGKYGLISADYEYIDYSKSSLKSYDYSFSSENTAIRNSYTVANNLRLGAEFKAGIAAFRAGYSYYGSPYKGSNSEGDRNGYSFGIGLRDKGYSVDFAYNHSKSMAYYYLYSISPASNNTIKSNSFSLTVGFRF